MNDYIEVDKEMLPVSKIKAERPQRLRGKPPAKVASSPWLSEMSQRQQAARDRVSQD